MSDVANSIAIGIREQGQGNNDELWGEPYLNDAIGILAQLATGYKAVALTGDKTVSESNYATDNETEFKAVKFTGSLSSAATYTVPSRQRVTAYWNDAGQTVTVKTSAGTGVAIPNGRRVWLLCDGSEHYVVSGNNLPGFTQTLDKDVATKDYVDQAQSDANDYTDTAVATASIPASTGAVLVSGNDSTAGFLGQKIVGAGSVSVSVLNDGADEDVQISVDVSDVETTADYALSLAAMG